MATKYIVSVDFGGTKILAALLDSKGEIVVKSKIATEARKGKAELIKRLAEIIRKVIAEGKVAENDIKAVSIGIPGSVNPNTGLIGTAPNLSIKNFNVKDELAKHISLPILIENDVNLAALGIQKYELNGEAKNVLIVFVGTGIGSALIFDNKLYRGSSYFAGEIGHMNVRKGGPLCGCGHKGCFEAVASRTAIVRDIRKDLRAGKKSVLREIVPSGKPIKSKSLAQAIKKKDKLTIKHITDASDQIGLTLANITNLLNLDLIVLGGGVIEALDKFMIPKIKEAFKKNVLRDSGKNIKIIATKLGDDAAIYGGLALADEMAV
ncbi:MAG: ROK family protein [Bacteroidota bacterium]|nr:ROK family protein [Bacteroidota bacterium]MDP4191718.1 ROK family protein [Bacteroidota bacterium]MDP4196451.1 ROK family protein [Bacteroidota bacterium]